MLSIYITAMLWSVVAIIVAITTFRLIFDCQVKSGRYIKYQHDQSLLANSHIQSTAVNTVDPAGYVNLTYPAGPVLSFTHSGPAFSGYTGSTDTWSVVGAGVGSTPNTIRRRVRRKPPTPPKPKTKKKTTEEAPPLMPMPPDNSFYDEPRME